MGGAPRRVSAPSATRESAVLVPLWRDAAGELRLVIVRRSERGAHGGQLAFPGGVREPADDSLLATALREAEEEIGLVREAVHPLAELPGVTTHTTGFMITPILARIERPAAWRLAADEVVEVLEPSLTPWLDPAARRFASDLAPPPWAGISLPYYAIGPHRLWGASERILTPLLARIRGGEWEDGLGH